MKRTMSGSFAQSSKSMRDEQSFAGRGVSFLLKIVSSGCAPWAFGTTRRSGKSGFKWVRSGTHTFQAAQKNTMEI
ncbi:unnamed protein product [Symbiodinium natans]|uniref:Uncharacterized protein n=1 Tax=Symbiodinium natans TaxID=878477 RepID=A0A812QDZ8_9DINO|nr:unnamed protein product [Symbiodinium natans]